MRKRNKPFNGIDKVYIFPKSCTTCKRPFFNGDDCWVEPEQEFFICYDCAGVTEQEDGAWYGGYFGDETEMLCISNLDAFEAAMGEKIER